MEKRFGFLVLAAFGIAILSVFVSGARCPNPVTYSVMGDSISQGFDADSIHPWDQPWNSYCVGTNADVNSMLQRLNKKYGGGSVAGYDNAVDGSTASDMPGQADISISQSPGFVTMMIGGNDACANPPTPVADFRANIHDALSRLRSSLPNSTVVSVTNVVNVPRLWSVKNAPNCYLVWAVVCPDLITPSGRQRMTNSIRQYNNAILREAREHGVNSVYDMYDYNFTSSEVNDLDCFHPSILGHHNLAAYFYNSTPYAHDNC